MRGIITLFIHNGINDIIGQAQENEHPGDQGPIFLSIYPLVLAISGGAKIPCCSIHLAGQTPHAMFIGGPLTWKSTFLVYLIMCFHIKWGGLFFVCCPSSPLLISSLLGQVGTQVLASGFVVFLVSNSLDEVDLLSQQELLSVTIVRWMATMSTTFDIL